MPTVFVQFADSTETAVVASFACPQDTTKYPYQGEIDDTDARYVAFADPTATLDGAIAVQIAAIEAACRQTITDALMSNDVTDFETYRKVCLAAFVATPAKFETITTDTPDWRAAVQAITWTAPATA